jgi:PAB1-binding protein PBP1
LFPYSSIYCLDRIVAMMDDADAGLSRVLKDGLRAMMANLTAPSQGLKVRITLVDGAEYDGTFSTSTDSAYTVKMVQQKKAANGDISNGTQKLNKYIGNGDQHTMSFQKRDVVDLHVTAASLPKVEYKSLSGTVSLSHAQASPLTRSGPANSFRTDTAISGNRAQGERVLQRWVPDMPEDVDASLESGRNSSGGGWDQFAANERLFGLKTDYDENIYTTSIDRSHPQYKQRMAEAERKAREIEGSVATNSHIAEERITDNLAIDNSGLDEEDK